VKSTDSPSLPRNEVAHEGRYGPVAQLQERDTSPNGTVFRQNVDSLAGIAPTALDSLAPEERHHVYKMLRLKVVAHSDEALEVSGAFGGSLAVCAPERGQVLWR
jgi:hypothetical protein